MKGPVNLCKCGCGKALKGGRADREFVSNAHRMRYDRSVSKEKDPETADSVCEVHRRVSLGELPDEYADAIKSLQEYRRQALDIPEMVTTLISGVCITANLHHAPGSQAARMVSVHHDIAALYARNLIDLGQRIQAAAQLAGEAFTEARMSDELDAVLYPNQVGHWWQSGPDPDRDESDNFLLS